MQNQRITISPTRLKNAVKKAGMTLDRASVKLGYADNYLSLAINRGYLTKPAVVSIENVLGIKLEDIQTEVDETEPKNDSSFDYVRLYSTIYSAVKNAMTDALNGDKKGVDTPTGEVV